MPVRESNETSWPVVVPSRLRLNATCRASGSSTLWPWYVDAGHLAPGICVVWGCLLTLLSLPVKCGNNQFLAGNAPGGFASPAGGDSAGRAVVVLHMDRASRWAVKCGACQGLGEGRCELSSSSTSIAPHEGEQTVIPWFLIGWASSHPHCVHSGVPHRRSTGPYWLG